MSCAALTADDLRLLAEYFVIVSLCVGAVGYAGGWMLVQVVDHLVERFRKRGAAAPFAERARSFERRAQRWAATFERIRERNQREADRRS